MPLTQLGKWTVLYSIVGLEVAAGGVCYYYWRRMNSSQDFRKSMHQKHPKVLELFYKTCDAAGAGYVREMDRHAWEAPGSGCSSQPPGEGNNENQRKP